MGIKVKDIFPDDDPDSYISLLVESVVGEKIWGFLKKDNMEL